MTRDKAIEMTERLIDAAVSYETAEGIYNGPARKELFEARNAIEVALCGVEPGIPATFGGYLNR